MKYKEGDKVVCVPGYHCGDNYGGSTNYGHNYGGYGYEVGEVFTIGSIGVSGYNHNFNILWPRGGGHGVFEKAVKLWEPITINRNIKKPKFI